MLRTLLIDDEVSARTDLRAKLAAHSEVEIVGEASTFRAARALLETADYDLVFLDVQLIGGDSFPLVPLVRPGATLIVATAHERYALRAFESRAVDYLLKPIRPSRLAEALRRATASHLPVPAAPHPPAPAAASVHFDAPTAPSAGESPLPRRKAAVEVELTRDERLFLRQMLAAWENTLHPAHPLREPGTRLRTVCYGPHPEPTRLFLAGKPTSALQRCWRALRRQGDR